MWTINITLSDRQFNFLKYVQAKCPEGDESVGNQFVRYASKAISQGWVTHQYPKKPAYLLTDKGKLIIALIELELKRVGNGNLQE